MKSACLTQPLCKILCVNAMWSCRDAQKCLQNLSGAKNGASRIGWRVETRASGRGQTRRARLPRLQSSNMRVRGAFWREKVGNLYGQQNSLQSIDKILTMIGITHPNIVTILLETELSSENVSQPFGPVEPVLANGDSTLFKVQGVSGFV